MGLVGNVVAAGLIAQSSRAGLTMGISSAIIAAMVLFAGIAIVPWSGSAERSPEPNVERELVFRMWMHHAVWLAAPWLVVPPAGMVLFGVLFLTRSLRGAEFWQFGTVFVLAGAWMGLVINALSVWRERWDESLRSASLHRTETCTKGVVAAGLLFLVGITSGLAGFIVYSLWAFRAM